MSVARFEVRTDTFDLNGVLRVAGLGALFGNPGGLSGLAGPGPLVVSDAKQSSLLRVHELGLEAASVSAVAVRRGVPAPTPVVEAVCDRPFLVVVSAAGLRLQTAWVADPVVIDPPAA